VPAHTGKAMEGARLERASGMGSNHRGGQLPLPGMPVILHPSKLGGLRAAPRRPFLAGGGEIALVSIASVLAREAVLIRYLKVVSLYIFILLPFLFRVNGSSPLLRRFK